MLLPREADADAHNEAAQQKHICKMPLLEGRRGDFLGEATQTVHFPAAIPMTKAPMVNVTLAARIVGRRPNLVDKSPATSAKANAEKTVDATINSCQKSESLNS